MAGRVLSLRNKSLDGINKLKDITQKITLPERFKGTIVEKWAKYWKQLGVDYKEAGISFIEECKNKPLKTSIYCTLIGSAYISSQRNPTEKEFIENLRNFNNDLILVHPSCHKTESSQHLSFIEKCLNEGVIRRLTLGVVSFMYIADYDKSVAIYKAMCPYLQPQYTKFHQRFIDYGFWNKWWILEKKMVDYDINE